MHSAAPYSMEIEFLRPIIWAIQARDYKSIVEIGVADGHASWWLFQAIQEPSHRLYLVDPALDHLQILTMLKPKFESIRVHKETSTKFFTESQVNKRFDFILIDGGHSYEECYSDFELSRKALSDDGMIAIHDTNFMAGVIRAMKDIKRTFPGTWMNYPVGKGLALYEPTTQWEGR